MRQRDIKPTNDHRLSTTMVEALRLAALEGGVRAACWRYVWPDGGLAGHARESTLRALQARGLVRLTVRVGVYAATACGRAWLAGYEQGKAAWR